MTKSIGQNFKFLSLLRFALPSMVMMVFMSLYTIVDGVFISRLVGSEALSASNIIYPATSILIAVGIMLATGGSAIIAMKLGEKKEQEARENFSMIILAGFIFGVLALVLGNLFLTTLVRLLGATDLIVGQCEAYLGTLLYFAPACVLQLFFQSFFVTAGRPVAGLIVTIAGGIANAILDYVFMGPMNMGIGGAALATGIGQLVPAIAGLLYFFFTKGDLHFVKPKLDLKVLKESCLNGSSEMVTNLSTAIVTYLFNIIMLKLLGETGVAAITIVLYGQFMFNSLYMGFAIGVAPVISYNYGSKNTVMLRRVFKICISFVVASAAVVSVMALFGSPLIVEIFTPKGTETYEIARNGFFLFSINYFFAGMNIFSSSLFTALSNGKISAAISFLRTFGFIVVCVLVLPEVIGVNGVWLAVPVAEFLTIFVSFWFLWRKKEEYQYAGKVRKPLAARVELENV